MSNTKINYEDMIMTMVDEELADDEVLETEESILDEQLEDGEKKAKAKDRKKVICKICREAGVWYSHGSFPNGTKKWVDESGLICNGKMCGKCNVNRAKGTMRRIRGTRVGETSS